MWPCSDGYVSFGLRGGKARQASLETITRLVTSEGLATSALADRDWTTFDHATTSSEELSAISEPIAAYFERHTMSELYEVACSTNLMLAPVNSPRHLIESAQLTARGFLGALGYASHFPLRFVKTVSPDGSLTEPGAREPFPALGSEAIPWPELPGGGSPLSWASPRRDRQRDADLLADRGRAPSGAWTGTRLLELGTGAAGPIATRYFAEHGATVIRVESRSRPDFLRVYGLRPGNPCGLEGSDMFDALNVGKLGMTINLKHEQGVRVFKQLVQWADAVAENFAPRALRGLGLDYDQLVADKPDLVMVSSCLMGQTGPHRDYPGFGGQGSALSGYNFLTGWPDREPVGPHGTITDSLSPRFSAIALAAALLYRWRTGKGVHLDVSQVESAIYSLAPWVLDYDVNGRFAERMGSRSTRFAPHGVFPCQGTDRWIAIACTDDAMWSELAQLLGIEDERLARLDERLSQVAELEERLAAYTIQRTAEDVANTLQDRNIEAIPVVDFADARDDSSLNYRGHFVDLEHPCMGERTYERNGFRLSNSPAGYERPSPLLGEHTISILQGIPWCRQRDVEGSVGRGSSRVITLPI